MTRFEQGLTKESCPRHDSHEADGACICRRLGNQKSLTLSLNELAAAQWEWLKSMGWADSTSTLEKLALVCSEVGEACNECRGEKPTDKLGGELADIILRTLGICAEQGINIEAEIMAKMEINKQRGTRGRKK